MDRNQFIKEMVNACGDQMAKAGLLTSVGIAQAILETGWGSSSLYNVAHNCHGLNNYHDEVTKGYSSIGMRVPQEQKDGRWTYSIENMCAFTSDAQSFECLVRWYTMRSKYKELIGCTDYKKFCSIIQGKFATDSHYAEKLIKIIEDYNLTQYDSDQKAPEEEELHYWVQTGAYSKLDYARAAVGAIKSHGIDALILYDGTYYRIQTGAFIFKANAEKVVAALMRAGFSSYIRTEAIPGEVVT